MARRTPAAAAPPLSTAAGEPEPLLNPALLTRLAFALSLILVLTRATMLEILREPLDVAPGSPPIPRGPGPATSLVLDLIAWMPALLVLARGAVDRAFRIRLTWAHAIAVMLAIWAVLSTFWASDKFAAAVSGFHLLSAIVFMWSASQLVRSWRRVRIVAGMCLGLLLVFAAYAMTSRFIDQPDARADWQANREERLRERGLEPGTFAATAFEAKLLRGEMMGFAASPNTFAATTVLLLVITSGVIIQRLRDRDGYGWIAVPALAVALGACIIIWTDSKAAKLSPLLAAGILSGFGLFGAILARRAKLVYSAGVTAVALAFAAVVGHGLHHGTLFIDSLTFRWRYWVGAWRIVVAHPLLGVGWDNFGLHYLATRLPIAAEEIRDPHDFIVRAFSELGVLGGAVLIAGLLRFWWELTVLRGDEPEMAEGLTAAKRSLPTLAIFALASALFSILAYVDLGFVSTGGSAGSAVVTLRVFERFVGAAIVMAGMWIVATRSMDDATLDDRPAPWVMRAMLAGLAVFLLHNLVDFSMFEIGPMFLFALIAGSATGMRSSGMDAGRRTRFVATGLVALFWIVAVVVLAIPVLQAEERLADSNELMRKSLVAQAAIAAHDAATAVPYNGDYSAREAHLLMMSGAEPAQVREAFDAAIAANPMNSGVRASRAMFEAIQPQPDTALVRANYDAALAIDPANVPMRLAYAETLERLSLPVVAREQYVIALTYNDQFAPDEPERLPPDKLAEIQAAIARLSASTQPATQIVR